MLTADQLNIAQTIIDVGQSLGATEKQIRAALAAGWVESRFKNLNYGDRDSLGVFQQRPSVGEWGTASEILNVEHAAASFFNTAMRMDRDNLSAGNLAANVQRPARQYRSRYDEAMSVVDSILGSASDAVDYLSSDSGDGSADQTDQPAGFFDNFFNLEIAAFAIGVGALLLWHANERK